MVIFFMVKLSDNLVENIVWVLEVEINVWIEFLAVTTINKHTSVFFKVKYEQKDF